MDISLKNVAASFYNQPVLSNITLDIESGSTLAIIGPSKAGKTTFLKLFNRLDEEKKGFKVTGKILIDGQSIHQQDKLELRRNIGIIFAKPYTLPGSVLSNLSFGLRIQGVKDDDLILQKIKQVLAEFDLWSYFEPDLDKKAKDLKSLKKQILALARVLILNPEILLFEQPTKYLSEIAARKLEGIIFDLRKRHTIILDVTNLQQAKKLSDSTVFLYNGNLIEFNNTTNIFTNPKMELTENYIRGKTDL